MTNLKLSSKMHILIIVSALVIVIGMAVGTICNFVAGGFFNWGADEASFKSVQVNYVIVEYSEADDVKKICDEVFDDVGVKYYAAQVGDSTDGGEITFRFTMSTDSSSLKKAVEKISAAFGATDSNLTYVEFHSNETVLTGAKAISRLAIAIASVIALQFIYFAIRYRLTMAFATLLANIHNLGVFAALLAICRVPVGTFALAFALVSTVVTFIACGFMFGRLRQKIKKDEAFAKLTPEAQTDDMASQSLMLIALLAGSLIVATAVLFVLLSISALSVVSIIGYVLAAIVAVVSSVYGTAFFIPPVYARFKKIGDDFNLKHARTKKQPKQKVKAGE